jgi:hypothetical protein
MRVAIVGNSGCGKSTLASQIAAAHPVTSLDLDAIASDVTVFCAAHERWVVDGGDAQLLQRVLEHSPLLLFVDPDDNLSLAAHRDLFEAYRGPKLRLAHRERPFLEDLGLRFEACAIPAREWTHAAHLVVGLWHVHRYGADEAIVRLRHGIRRLNESHGAVNSVTGGYHETITAVYVQLLAQFLAASGSDMSLEMRAIALLASPLAAKDALLRFYSRERLMSTEARASWIAPDIALTVGHFLIV